MKIVKYVQANCVPCKMVNAFMGHLGVKADEEILLSKEEDFAKARDLGVMKTPTIILYGNDGQEVTRVAGVGQGKIQELFQTAGRL